MGEINAFFVWVESNRYVIFPFFLIFGVLMCFAGKTYLKWLIFVSGVIEASTLIILVVYSTFASHARETWVGYVTVLGSIAIGAAFGLFLMKNEMIGGFFLVAWGGFNTGLLFYNAFLYKINSDWALWGFSVGIGILYAVLLIFLYDHILIHATAMMGSFSFIFGIGLVAGHYPSPFLIVDLIKYGQIKAVDPLYYAYFGANLVLYVIGCIWQYKRLA